MADFIDASLFRDAISNEYSLGEITSVSVFNSGSGAAGSGQSGSGQSGSGQSGSGKSVSGSPLLAFRDNGGTIFLIESAVGKFALKAFSANQPAKQCLLEASLIKWLKAHNFALVPNVIGTKGGALVSEVGARRALLLDYIPCSREQNWTSSARLDAECSAAGEVLALLQNRLSTLPRELVSSWGLSPELPPSSVGNDGQVGVASIRPYLQDWLSIAFKLIREETHSTHSMNSTHATHSTHSINSKLKESALAQADRILAIAKSAEQAIEKVGSNKTLFVHGDFHTGNLIWQQEKILSVIDFENAHYEHPIYDLAYAILMFSSNWQAEPGKPQFDLDLGVALIVPYLKHSAVVTESELTRLLSAYIQLTGVLILLWVMHDCMRANRFEAQLRFLLTNLSGLQEFGDALVAAQASPVS